jgi:hypothetical protein
MVVGRDSSTCTKPVSYVNAFQMLPAHRTSQSETIPLRRLLRDKSLRTLAVLNIVPPGPKNGGSIADAPINSVHLLGMLHIVDLIC